jgi:hypothetical protein
MPFHDQPSMELDPKNLITLCMGKTECHLTIGHGGSFEQYNPNVARDAADVLAHPDQFIQITQVARFSRKPN